MRLMTQVTDLADAVAAAARRSALVIAGAALLLAVVLRAEPGVGFGWSFPGWWILALAPFAPAAILYGFSRSAAKLVGAVRAWPERVAGAVNAGLDATVEFSGAVRTAVVARRGLVGLATALWGMRRVIGDIRGVAGEAVPALAAASPGYLLLAAVSALGGVMLVVLAVGVLVLRILV